MFYDESCYIFEKAIKIIISMKLRLYLALNLRANADQKSNYFIMTTRLLQVELRVTSYELLLRV